MAAPTVPSLNELGRRIAQQESELAALRQEHKARSALLGDLNRHKEELQAQLRQIEAEIASVSGGDPAAEAAPRRNAAKRAPAKAGPPAAGKSTRPRLRTVLIKALRQSRKPRTARELAEQLLADGYPTDSKDFVNTVQVSLTRIPGVEHAPEGGYRLKKGS
jgi:hypothetical protein